jgi:hypothetical protein
LYSTVEAGKEGIALSTYINAIFGGCNELSVVIAKTVFFIRVKTLICI